MGKEIYFVVTANDLANSLAVAIECKPLIDTNTRALGQAGWCMSYRQNILWGRPKIRIYDPNGKAAISIKLNNGNPYKPDYWHNKDSLLSHMITHGALCFVPTTMGFTFGENPADTISDLRIGLGLANATHDHLQTERLVKELQVVRDSCFALIEESGATVKVKDALRSEIVKLKSEVETLQNQLHVFENESSLDIIERLNQESYNRYVADRPRRQREANDLMDRIFKTVSDLIEKIHSELPKKVLDEVN